MSSHKACDPCHWADVDGFEIVVIDPENLWRAERGSLPR
jgi:hypothetical protein